MEHAAMTPVSSQPKTYILTLGGRIRCLRCSAMSKRTGVQCGAVAIKGKTKCRAHGGLSTGPKTVAGKARIAAAHLVHGRETREARSERSKGLARLSELEAEALRLGIISGKKKRI